MFLILLLIVGFCSGDPYQNNPFYVDKSSVVERDYGIDMTLRNHHVHSPNPDPFVTAANPEIKLAFASFEALDKRVLRFKMSDARLARWEAPIYNPDKFKDFEKLPIKQMGMKYYDNPFSFEVADPVNKVGMLSSFNSSLKFYDKYIEFGMRFPTQRVFGMGERVTPDFELCTGRTDCIYTTFTKGATSPLDKGVPPGGKNMYGHHPFYLLFLKQGLFVGILFLNSNAQDTLLHKFPDGSMEITHKTVGGIIDYFIFYADKSEVVLRKYHALIGRPYVPPFWSLGFHQCRWGWKSLKVVEQVVARFEQSDIPLDVVWSDIDYMKEYADFSIDPVNYAGLGKFVEKIRKRDIHWVPIIDAGIKYGKDDPYYVLGEKMNTFIKSAVKKRTLVGKVWPGAAVFPDWYHPNSTLFWHKGLGDLHAQAAFDGVWLDMNECSIFCHGECDPNGESHVVDAADPHDPHEFDNLPYTPGNRTLIHRSISMTGYHYAENEYGHNFHKEYNLHSLWAVGESKATYSFLKEKIRKRPFVVTRASFPGSGMYTSKWLGDNHSTWEDMRYSITGLYNSQLYGIPLNGADMCGFSGDSNEELCLRWMQLGSFYPFSRNHNTRRRKPQEPFIWPSVAKASRNAIRQKYSILRYYYTKLFEVSLYGGSLIRPLFFDWPTDEKAYASKNETFMIGSAIMVAPVLYRGVRQVHPYLSNENWYDLFRRNALLKHDPSRKEGKTITMDGNLEYVNVLLRGGNIIPFQNALVAQPRRVTSLNFLPMEMIVALDHHGQAQGTIIVDDDSITDPLVNDNYRYMRLSFVSGSKELTVSVTGNYGASASFEAFAGLSIWGAQEMAEIRTACVLSKGGEKKMIKGSYDNVRGILSFRERLRVRWPDISSIQLGATC